MRHAFFSVPEMFFLVVAAVVAVRYLVRPGRHPAPALDRGGNGAYLPAPTNRLPNGQTLALPAGAVSPDSLRAVFGGSFPDWPVVASLLQAAAELNALERGCATARAAGVPQVTTDRLREEAQTATVALRHIAERLASVRAQGVDSPRLQQGLDQQRQRLDRLYLATHQARETLAEWTLFGGDSEELEQAEARLQNLAAAAREVMNSSEPPEAEAQDAPAQDEPSDAV